MKSAVKNIEWLDTLRALATVGVIIIHNSTPVVNMTYGRDMNFWWIGNSVDSAVRFAVPLFLMLSGATLLSKEYKLGEFYKKRVVRVLVPLLFWMLCYWVFRWAMLESWQQPKEFSAVMHWARDLFLSEGISKHFWYVYMILFIYLFVPFLGKAVRALSNSWLLTLLVAWVVLFIALRPIPINFYRWSDFFGYKLLGYFLYTGYLVLGYYLMRIRLTWSKTRMVAAAIFILSIASSAIYTYFASKNAHRLDLSIYSYLTVNTAIQSIALFIWAKDLHIGNRFLSGLQKTISNYSYGIYLVHIIVIGIFFRNNIFWTMAHPLISLPIIVLATLVCSFAIIFVLRKIPFGKYISG